MSSYKGTGLAGVQGDGAADEDETKEYIAFHVFQNGS